MTKNFTYKHRLFIDTQESADSYINANVKYAKPHIGKSWDNGKRVFTSDVRADIKLADCYRAITWDFTGKNGLKKLKMTRAALLKFFAQAERALNYEKDDKPLYTTLKKECNAKRKP